MKLRFTSHLLAILIALLTASCSKEEVQAQTTQQNMKEIHITIDGVTKSVQLVDNAATRELAAVLQEAPITYEADDYGGFEKVGALGRSLPTSNSQLTTTAGDVILYNGNQIVLFYGSNSWSYTRLGHIDYASLDELKAFLKAGWGRISVTLSASKPDGIKPATAAQSRDKAYAIDGTELRREPAKGIYIKDGKKIIK